MADVDPNQSEIHLFRRAEDWERLTRLEYLVQELGRENERVDRRIDGLVQKQETLQETQDKMLRVAVNIRMILIGAIASSLVFMTGLSKLFPVLFNIIVHGAP